MEGDTVRISKKHKVGLITVGMIEIIFAMGSITASAISISVTNTQYWKCFYYNSNPNYPVYHCPFYNWLYRYSLTAQGIWTGCMVIISAGLNMRLAANPTKEMGSISGGFSILSFILTAVMIILESFPVAEGYYRSDDYNDHRIWYFHRILLSFASVLFVLTLTNVILSYAVIGFPGCCCKESTAVQPVRFYNDDRSMTAHPSRTISSQEPIPTQQIQLWQHIPSDTNGQSYLVSFPRQLQSNLAFIPKGHNQNASNREALLIPPPYNQVPTLQTPPHFHPQQTQVGTVKCVSQRSSPAVQNGQITTNENRIAETSPTNLISLEE